MAHTFIKCWKRIAPLVFSEEEVESHQEDLDKLQDAVKEILKAPVQTQLGESRKCMYMVWSVFVDLILYFRC